MKNILKHYKSSISMVLGVKPERIFLYWKGRVGLYAILKSLGIGNQDEVIIQGFTCVVVSNAIIYLGAKPVYVDIEPQTMNTSISLIRNAITVKTKAIILQNTFGLSSGLEEITILSKSHGIPTIEDCTHGFGGFHKGKPNGSYCDAAFFSTQWNKSMSTGIGGFIVVNNKRLLEPIKATNQELFSPKLKEVVGLWLMIKFNNALINRSTFWILRKIYRWLSKIGLVVGSSENAELVSVLKPVRYFKSACKIQAREGSRQIAYLKDKIEIRKKNARRYTEFLKKHGKTYVEESLFNDHCFTKYSILVKNRNNFMKMGERNKVILDDWFCSPLHPIKDDLSTWSLKPEELPIAVKISNHIVNISSDTKDHARILSFLQKNIDELL